MALVVRTVTELGKQLLTETHRNCTTSLPPNAKKESAMKTRPIAGLHPDNAGL